MLSFMSLLQTKKTEKQKLLHEAICCKKRIKIKKKEKEQGE